MTRKRKNVESVESSQKQEQGEGSSWTKQEVEETRSSSYDVHEEPAGIRRFPKKKFENKKYYRQNEDGEENWNKRVKHEDGEEKRAFPTELCHYLKSMEALRNTQPLKKLENEAYEKCASECEGEEIALLTFKETCVLIESLFGSSPYAARLYLTGICRSKHARILDSLFSGCSAKAVEQLLYCMALTHAQENVKIIDKLTEILCENWNEAVGDQNAAFILRALSRICCGLPKRGENDKNARFSDKSTQSPKFLPEYKPIFAKISQLALDYSTVKDTLNYPVCSLLIQDVIECEKVSKGTKHRKFLQHIMENMQKGGDADKELVIQQWEGKNSSRIWDALVSECDEDSASLLWMYLIQPKMHQLCAHPAANFVLQRFIEGIRSFDLATDVLDELAPQMKQLVESSRTGIICALVQCAQRHEQLQETLLKSLRICFQAEKTNTKTRFLYNALTLNQYNGVFDNSVFKPLGCILVTKLLKLSKRKTLVSCLLELPAEHIRTMAFNNLASRVLQAAMESPQLENEVKEKIIAAFEDNWVELISDSIGSHLFERIWDRWGVREKQDLLKKLVPIRNESRFYKFAMLRADMNLFRKDRKAWVAKMKKQKEEHDQRMNESKP